MSTRQDEREWIAMHLYEEHRVDSVVQARPGGAADPPMWHEVDDSEQLRWMGKAARLQEWLVTCRRLARA